MNPESHRQLPKLPTAADYQAIIDKLNDVGQAFVNREIDTRTFSKQIALVEQERRRLQAMEQCFRLLQKAAAQAEKQ